MSVESDGLDHGATFTVSLPLGEAAPPRHPPAALTGADQPANTNDSGAKNPSTGDATGRQHEALKNVRLLLVEDEADQRYLLERILKEHGAEVLVAEDSATGLDILQAQRPLIIVSDVGLPKMDGYEFLRRVRALPPEKGGRTPAVALTAFARAEDRQLALRAGFQAHITKPADTEELVSIITNLIQLVG